MIYCLFFFVAIAPYVDVYAPVSDRRNEIWARRATVEQHRRRSALFGSRQPSCRTEQPEEYIGYDSLRSPLVPIDRRHFAKPFSVSQKLMIIDDSEELLGSTLVAFAEQQER